MMDKNKICFLVEAGLVDYRKALEVQKKTHLAKKCGKIKEDVLFVLEHPPTITIGRKGSIKEILADEIKLKKEGISVYHIGRGGKVTYHGPGQLVGYPVLDLTDYGKDLHLYLRNLEEVIIETLRDFSVPAGRRKGLTGVWVDSYKIASIGIEIKNWISLHGFALNINCNLNHFTLINPCGMHPSAITSLEKILGYSPPLEEVISRLTSHFARVFSVSFLPERLDKFQEKIG